MEVKHWAKAFQLRKEIEYLSNIVYRHYTRAQVTHVFKIANRLVLELLPELY